MGRIAFYLIQEPAELRGRETIDVGKLKIHGQLDFIIFAIHLGELGNIRLVGFADQHGLIRILIDDVTHFAENVMNLREVVRVFMLDLGIAVRILPRQNGIVTQFGILKKAGDGVNPKASHATVKPEAHRVIHGLADLRIAPIEIGLFLVEIMVVVLIRCGIKGPCGMAEPGKPIIRGTARALSIAPDIPVTLRIRAGRAGLLEPGMLIRGVVGNVIQDDTNASFLCFADQTIEVGERPVEGIDGGVIRNVVAKIHQGRGIDGADPDGVNAQVAKVIEARNNPIDVAYAIAVRILEAARINLIEDRVLPPMARWFCFEV